jgi:hypothetical protein
MIQRMPEPAHARASVGLVSYPQRTVLSQILLRR